MIGIFDSGLGGLTVLRALHARFPREHLVYFGDQANVPYGNRPAAEVVALTRAGITYLFEAGCRLVLLGCNTATAVAARTLQRDWLPNSPFSDCRILGIIAPTVEAATQTPWAVATPQYPQKYNTDVIAIFGTARTIASNVYPEEIGKRCPRVRVVQQTCAQLAGAIESGAPEARLDAMIADGAAALLGNIGTLTPDRAILGCTHFPLVEHLFRRHLPPATRILSQPEIVADSLEDYLHRHPRFSDDGALAPLPQLNLRTSGVPAEVHRLARIFWPTCPAFAAA
ncbi:MAG: aspartate/glutamate racemase family protein [Hyphomicrobiaceae bacterium]